MTEIRWPQEPPRLSIFELAYLIAGRSDASAERSRDLIGIPELAEGDDLLQAGLSSLVARGMIDQDAEGVLPRNEIGLIGMALGTATQWVSISMMLTHQGVEQQDNAFFVFGPKVSVLMRPAPASTFDFLPVDPSLSPSVAVSRIIDTVFTASPVAKVLVRSASFSDDDSVLIGNFEGEGWKQGSGVVFPTDAAWPAPDLELEESDRERALASVGQLLERHAA